MIPYDPDKLFQTLSELGVIEPTQLSESYKESKSKKVPFHKILLDNELLTDENLGQILAELFGVPFVKLSQVAIPHEVLTLLPQVYAKSQQIIVFRADQTGVHVATTNPANQTTLAFVVKKTGLPVSVYFTTEREIDGALLLYAKNVTQAFEDIIQENVAKVKGATKADPPIIKIVDTILSYAHHNKASDIHIEPTETFLLVRFRIDGILHDIVELPKDLHEQIVTRIKVLARLRTDEHLAAQDGKIHYAVDEETVDVRVSIVPITDGEKIVMRLLSERSRQLSLTDLGFGAQDLEKVKEAYEKPYGMIMATGPTGSGKTTTMYAVLKLLNKRDVNIMTIEDPVEYDIEHINQIQVNAKTNLTFAAGLRSIVRQDPDIILVGEIRDEETANIAINAAMTGHLVLSTLHTNDSATAIPRLMDMKIEPFLVGSTVNVVIAQRLIRKICLSCRTSIDLTRATLEKEHGKEVLAKLFGTKTSIRAYEGKGCEVCHQTGFTGRVGIFEVLVINDAIRQAIVKRENASVIRDIAVKQGMATMLDDGIQKVKEGLTTIDEVMRSTVI
jgi:type II secretory ATPase GspE/PulE/Tfp pilus assembly ATPase PilB-like protein